MKKIKKLLKIISLVIKEPSLLISIIEREDVSKKAVIEKYALNKGLRTINILDLIPDLHEKIEPLAFLDGSSSPIDIVLLCSLAKKKKDCDYLEIGNWRGESLANVARYAHSCTGINISDEEMGKMGLSKKYIDLHYFFSKGIPNINIIRENSLSFNFSSMKKSFDLIFIDGDHHYDTVKSDTQNAFKVLKDHSSIIVWHDYAYSPNNIRWNVLQAILDGCPKEKIKDLYYVSNTHCAIYFPESIKSELVEDFLHPDKIFSLQITAKKLNNI